MTMADFQTEVANAFQFVNPINWIKPKQSREGMLLETYVKNGLLRPERVGELFAKQKAGASSAQILQEVTASPEQYFVKTEEERQIALLKAKALIEQQVEERRQVQSRQMGGIMEQFRQPQGMPQGLPQMLGQQLGAMPMPEIPQTIPQGGLSMFSPKLSIPQSMPQMPSSQQAPGSISQNGLPQGQALSLPQQNTPTQGQSDALGAMIAMWNAGLGPTEPEKLADIIQKLLPTLSPSEQRQMMENQALQGLTPGSKEYRQEFLTKTISTAQQEAENILNREKFEQSKKETERDYQLAVKKLQQREKETEGRKFKISERILNLPLEVQSKATDIVNNLEKLKQAEILDIDDDIYSAEQSATAFVNDAQVYSSKQAIITALKNKRKTVIDDYDKKIEKALTELRNVSYSVGKHRGLESPMLDLIKSPPSGDEYGLGAEEW